MLAEIMMYSIVQKEGLGLDKAVEVAKDRYAAHANILATALC